MRRPQARGLLGLSPEWGPSQVHRRPPPTRKLNRIKDGCPLLSTAVYPRILDRYWTDIGQGRIACSRMQRPWLGRYATPTSNLELPATASGRAASPITAR